MPSGLPQLRIFLSSTFRDMHEEREQLIKVALPQLRHHIEQYRATVAEVDFRWGVTNEEATAGRILHRCFEEIDRSRPFFLAFFGRRYGQTGIEIPEDLCAQHPWLRSYTDRSVTELEVRYAVLNAVRPCEFARFYVEVSDADVPPGGQPPDLRHISALLAEIAERGFQVREYRDPAHLGQLVVEDFRPLLASIAGREQPKTESARHELFASLKTTVYITRAALESRLNKQLIKEGPPLIVVGPPGSGKTALLAHFASTKLPAPPVQQGFLSSLFSRQAPAPRKQLWLTHFVGATPDAGYWPSLVRHLLESMSQALELPQSIPQHLDDLRLTFWRLLHLAATNHTIVLIIDGLDEVEARDQGQELEWLPRELPAHVHLFLSCRPGPILELLQQRGARLLELPPLDESERDALIRLSLERYSKRLDPELRRRIRESPAAGNALYLRLFLEELRVFGDHERLSSRIAQYLRAPGPLELYLEVLSRLEIDYGGRQPQFVPSLLRLLFASYRGLSEPELLAILSTQLGPIDTGQFWPLYLALHEALISHGGRLTFANQQVRDAVAHRYCPTRIDQDAPRRQLVRYFMESGPTERKLDELPWQFMRLEDVDALRDCLTTPEFLRESFRRNELDVLSYWSWLESHSQFRLKTAYAGLVEPPATQSEIAAIVAVLLQQSGYAADALALWSKMGEHGSATLDPQLRPRIFREQALILGSLGHYARALELLMQEEQMYKEPQDRTALHSCLGNQGAFLRKLGRLDEAMRCHQREETLCRELNDLFGLAASLGNQGSILYDQKRAAEAQRLFTEQERLCRHKGDLLGLRACLGGQATLLFECGKREKALALHREAERICRQLGDRAGLQSCLARQTEVLMELEDYDAAWKLLDEQERLGLDMKNYLALATTQELRGTMFLNMGAMVQAAEQYQLAYKLCVEHGLQEQAARLEARIRQELHGYSTG